MRQENLALSTTADTIRKRDIYEIVTIINPSSTGITAYVNLRGGPATSADAPILAGQALTITLGVNDVGASIVAASATPTVILLRESFLTEEDFLAFGPLFVAISLGQANYWTQVSGTQIQLAGPFIEARADDINAKTGANGLRIGAGTIPSGGIAVGSIGLVASQVNVGHSSGGVLQMGSGGFTLGQGGTPTTNAAIEVTAGVLSFENGRTVSLFNGYNTDPRIVATPTSLALNTPVAGGSINSVFRTIKVPIKNGSTIANADIVIWDPNNGNRVVTTGATTDVNVLGQCVVGGTGNAGGTVFAEVIIDAYLSGTLTADTVGVTAGQFLVLGAATVGRVDSATTRTNASFGRALKTAASGVVVDWKATDCT